MKRPFFVLLTVFIFSAISFINFISTISKSSANSTSKPGSPGNAISLTDNDPSSSIKCEAKISFDGLQVLAFGDPSKVTTAILDVPHHTPIIEISKTLAGKTTIISRLTSELKNQSFNINLANNRTQPTRYQSGNMFKDAKDFRWCLDLESDLFQKRLYLKQDSVGTKVNFSFGTFYAKDRTDAKYKFVAGSKIAQFGRQIGAPAAQQEIQANDSIVISGGSLKDKIVLPYAPGVSYHINITNLPPADMANMDHFAFYYDALSSKVTRFMPVEMKKAAYGPRPYLCGTVSLGSYSFD